MKIKKVTLGKEFKMGLPNFSNVTASVYLEAEVGENEEIDYDSLWDNINQELSIQTGDIDPTWITTGEFKNFFKTTIKVAKRKEGDDNE